MTFFTKGSVTCQMSKLLLISEKMLNISWIWENYLEPDKFLRRADGETLACSDTAAHGEIKVGHSLVRVDQPKGSCWLEPARTPPPQRDTTSVRKPDTTSTWRGARVPLMSR